MSLTLQIALMRARMVARRNVQRAVQILLDARVAFAAAVRFVLAVCK